MTKSKATVIDDAGYDFPEEFLAPAPSHEVAAPEPEAPPAVEPAPATTSTYGVREPRTIRSNHIAEV